MYTSSTVRNTRENQWRGPKVWSRTLASWSHDPWTIRPPRKHQKRQENMRNWPRTRGRSPTNVSPWHDIVVSEDFHCEYRSFLLGNFRSSGTDLGHREIRRLNVLVRNYTNLWKQPARRVGHIRFVVEKSLRVIVLEEVLRWRSRARIFRLVLMEVIEMKNREKFVWGKIDKWLLHALYGNSSYGLDTHNHHKRSG